MNNLDQIMPSRGSTDRMPVLFVGHGSPMNAIENNEFSRGWQEVAKTFSKPKAIICISAHWETMGTQVTGMEKPVTIHDFGGFPRALFEVQYPAPGDPALASDIIRSVTGTGVVLDEQWGLDHGAWSVLRRMYPAADIPVVQLSLDYTRDARYHYDLGRELAPLREKGVLVLGSGNMVHNLGRIARDRADEPGFAYDWAIEANEKIKSFILSGDHAALLNYRKQGRAFELAIPSPDHFLPLLYTLALKQEDESIRFFNDKATMGSLTMTSLKIGGA